MTGPTSDTNRRRSRWAVTKARGRGGTKTATTREWYAPKSSAPQKKPPAARQPGAFNERVTRIKLALRAREPTVPERLYWSDLHVWGDRSRLAWSLGAVLDRCCPLRWAQMGHGGAIAAEPAKLDALGGLVGQRGKCSHKRFPSGTARLGDAQGAAPEFSQARALVSRTIDPATSTRPDRLQTGVVCGCFWSAGGCRRKRPIRRTNAARAVSVRRLLRSSQRRRISA